MCSNKIEKDKEKESEEDSGNYKFKKQVEFILEKKMHRIQKNIGIMEQRRM